MLDRLGNEVDFTELFMEETLSAKDKKELPDSMYGLVYTDENGKKIRKFPLNDESHVRQAAIFFDRAKGLSEDQKRTLARNIVRRAKELDMDYSGWESLKPYLDKSVKESYDPNPDSTSGTSEFDDSDHEPDDCYTESFEEMFGPVIQEAFDAITGEEIPINHAYTMEEMKERRIFSLKEMMRRKVVKISTKHQKIDKRRNKMLEEKKKRKEFLLQKRTEELMKAYNHRSQLDIFKQEQEKKLIEQKLNNEEREKKLEQRIKYLQQQKEELNFKKREKSAEFLLKSHEKKEEQLSQLIQKINKKHEENDKRMQEYYKELDIKNKKFKTLNVTRRNNQKFLLESIEKKRQKKIDDYFNENIKKEQNIIIRKAIKLKKILNQKSHEEQFLELVKGHKNQIELRNKKRKVDLENKMEEIGNRIINYKKEEEHKSLRKIQESFVKQMEKEFMNKRINRIKAYKYKLKEKEMEEREKRIELMKSEKLNFQNQKKQLNIELKNEKSYILDKFNKLSKSKSNLGSEIIKKLYPDDDELYNRIKKLQNNFKIDSLNKSVEEKNKVHSTKNTSFRKKKEQEIEKKVEEFRRRLREGITRDIESERVNETRRIREYEEASTINDKKIIEERNKLERKEFGKKINELNENIEKYVEDYRKKLSDESRLY